LPRINSRVFPRIILITASTLHNRHALEPLIDRAKQFAPLMKIKNLISLYSGNIGKFIP